MATETNVIILLALAILASVSLLIIGWRWNVDKDRFKRIMQALQDQTAKVRAGDWEQIIMLKQALEVKRKTTPLFYQEVPSTYEGRWQDQDHEILSGEGGKGWQDPNHPIIV